MPSDSMAKAEAFVSEWPPFSPHHAAPMRDALAALLDEAKGAGTAIRPRVVCLCGSTRFYDAFQRENYRLTMAGEIVLTVGFYPHAQEQAHGGQIGCTPEQKEALDELHLRKIDMADYVRVLNVGGYIGSSTSKEIAYAKRTGKPVEYLEAPK